MEWLVIGGTNFNVEALKGANLEKLIEDHKDIVKPELVKAAWEEVNGKHKPEKAEEEPKKNPKKGK